MRFRTRSAHQFLLVFAFFACARGVGEFASAAQPDGESAVLHLPHDPTGFLLAANAEWVLTWRNEQADDDALTKLAVINLAEMEIVAERTVRGNTSKVLAADQYACLYFPENRQLTVYTLPELSEAAVRELPTDPQKLVLIANEFIEAPGQGRWSLPRLELTDGDWAFSTGASAFAVGDGWFIDGFIYDQDLTGPVRFCGHPALFAADVTWLDHGTPAPPVGNRVAPFLRVLGVALSSHRLWQYQLVTPVSEPLQPGVFPPGSPSPDATKMRRWLRLQIVTPQRLANDFNNKRLLGKIRADLPATLRPEQLLERSSRTRIAMRRQRCVAVLAQHLFCFNFNDACFDRLPVGPRFVQDHFPIVIRGDEVTTWPLQLSHGGKIKELRVLSGNSIRYDADTKDLSLNPLQAREYNVARTHLLRQRVSPRDTLDEAAYRVRAQNAALIQRLEKLSQKELTGLPMAISFRLKATCEDGSTAELGGAVVADLPLELFREEFEKRQATRLARLQQPPPIATDAVKLPPNRTTSEAGQAIFQDERTPESTEMGASAEDDSPSSEQVTHTPTPASAADEQLDALAAPEAISTVLLETGVNLFLSAFIGGSLLWIGCRLHASGLPPEEIHPPAPFARLLVAMLVLSMFFVGIESCFLIWGRGAIQLEGLPYVLVGGISVLVAGLVRLVATVVLVPLMLRISINDIVEILVFFWLLAFLPTAALLGVWFAWTLA
jgi:hypothetical protein